MQESKNKFKYVKIALNEVKFEGSSRWQWGLSGAISLVLSIITCFSKDTIEILKTTASTFNSVSLAIIAMIFTAYALFQALLNDDMVWEMSKYNNLLETSNQSFLGVFFLYLSNIIINTILIIILSTLPTEFGISNDYWIDSTICFVFIWIYEIFTFRILIEIRNFAINIYKVFIAHNKLSLLKKENKEEKEENETLYKMLEIKRLKELKMISEEEYEDKRKEFLKRM